MFSEGGVGENVIVKMGVCSDVGGFELFVLLFVY